MYEGEGHTVRMRGKASDAVHVRRKGMDAVHVRGEGHAWMESY